MINACTYGVVLSIQMANIKTSPLSVTLARGNYPLAIRYQQMSCMYLHVATLVGSIYMSGCCIAPCTVVVNRPQVHTYLSSSTQHDCVDVYMYMHCELTRTSVE